MVLARLLMKDYDLVILDEPCASMDIPSMIQTEQLLRSYCNRTGASLVIITHSLAQAKRLSDQVLFFHEGSLLESDIPSRILTQPEKKETKQFLEFFS